MIIFYSLVIYFNNPFFTKRGEIYVNLFIEGGPL